MKACSQTRPTAPNPTGLCKLIAAFALLNILGASSAWAQEPSCDGQPTDVRLSISVDHVARAEGQIAATVYPDDRKRFLAHHGQIAVVRRPSEAGETQLCLWLPAPGHYEVAVYQDLNSDGRFDRSRLGLPTEPYGLSNDPPNLLGLPTFRSVRFEVHAGDNTIHIPLHKPPA